MRQLGVVFGMCSDEIDLEPGRDVSPQPHHPHADRYPGSRRLGGTQRGT
jgi:hypothetical protein